MSFRNALTFVSALSALLASAGAQVFHHPGVVVNEKQLDFVKAKIAEGAEPWKTAFARMKSSNYASANYTPHPRANVECGSYSNPNNGCSEERDDAAAAYAHALLWAYTGNKADADKAIQILNAWSAVLTEHTNSNAPLQAGWAASLSVRAAEIIRHTYDGWKQADVDKFSAMLRNAYLPCFPKIGVGTNGNWHLIAIDAALGIAVFLDDRALFDEYVAKWRNRTRAYLYINDDGPSPYLPAGLGKTASSYWYGMTTYTDGLAQETCRDFGHTGYGLASINTAAETALLQGVDLYAEESKRIVAGMEFHAAYLLGQSIPKSLCGGKLNLTVDPTWEVSYNHFVNRRGLSMPFTKKLLETKARPTSVDHHMAWETLTHANTGSVALEGMPGGGQANAVREPGAADIAGGAGNARLLLGGDGRLQIVKTGADGRVSRYGLNGALLP